MDIELSKITDTKLVLGMLSDLYSKEGYNADKKSVIQRMAIYTDNIENIDLVECNAYYIEQIKEYRKNMVKSPGIHKLTAFVSILTLIKDSNDLDIMSNKDFVNFIKDLSKDDFDFFKNMMVKQEAYELVVHMDNIYK